MGIYMIRLVIRVIVVCFFMLISLGGCSFGQNYSVRSTYSLSPESYMDLGYLKHNDVWRDLHTLLTFDNGVTVKIHPSSWYSFTHSKEFCYKDNSEFYFQVWGSVDTFFYINDSYFLSSSGDKVSISEIKVAETDTVLYSKPEFTDAIHIKKSSLLPDKLYMLWQEGNYSEMQRDPARQYLKVTSEKFVGCATDHYRLYLSFRTANTDEKSGYWLYFYPVEYKTFSR
ncbi:hypothetical protein QE250_06720 [Chromatiaceae bacterium AAb-1]|nr:hypothetical protein [Chromatiaceae bacterium AAb-1]